MTKVKTIAGKIGPKIRLLLQEGDIKWLANECGCSRQTVGCYLDGAYGNDEKVIRVIETALDKIITRGEENLNSAKKLKTQFKREITLYMTQSKAS